MNKLNTPDYFNDRAALRALSENRMVRSYPELQPHVEEITSGYDVYEYARGNAFDIPKVELPNEIEVYLRSHYKSPSRDINYINTIRDESEVNACPMCGSFHSGTLDHILPKEDFAEYSIFGPNLVPACKCNSRRGRVLTGASPNERILHPYFDDVLNERILAASLDDIGAVPKITLRIVLEANNPQFAAVRFHVENIVLRTGILRFMSKCWVDLLRRPSLIAMELRRNPSSPVELARQLERQREREDEFHGSKNNWSSIFLSGLMQDNVLDWLYVQLNRPGREADGRILE